MKWRWRFRIVAPVEAIYEVGFAPDNWMKFFKAHRGMESVDQNWPVQGSKLTLRYAVAGPWVTQMKHTVVEHERGRRVRIYEELLSGWWIDDIEFRFDPGDGVTEVTVVSNPTSKVLLVRPLLLLFWPIGALMTIQAMKRFKAIVEGPKTA